MGRANGGAGAASTLTNAVKGATNGGYLKLYQTATGGAGGGTYSGASGAGGAASSSLTFDDTQNPRLSTDMKVAAYAVGGHGGLAG